MTTRADKRVTPLEQARIKKAVKAIERIPALGKEYERARKVLSVATLGDLRERYQLGAIVERVRVGPGQVRREGGPLLRHGAWALTGPGL